MIAVYDYSFFLVVFGSHIFMNLRITTFFNFNDVFGFICLVRGKMFLPGTECFGTCLTEFTLDDAMLCYLLGFGMYK